MKKFICGFLCGAVLCTVIGAFAVNSIYENPYKITVNGVEKSIQGYNIDDYSYFKLRDIADAVGGFNVDFDNDTIVLSTGEQVTDVTPSPASLPQGTIPDPIYIQVPAENGDYNVVVTNDEFKIPILKEVNGEFCVPAAFIADKANEIVGYEKYSRGYKIYNMEIIPWTIVFDCGKSYPTLEYYYLNIAPWLQSLTQ
ncbi:MAG: hypothetical protein MRZ66_01705 [Clostridiales bacterium]|nr:hypothetical protein [Clostridiales bacterium]